MKDKPFLRRITWPQIFEDLQDDTLRTFICDDNDKCSQCPARTYSHDGKIECVFSKIHDVLKHYEYKFNTEEYPPVKYINHPSLLAEFKKLKDVK